MHSHLPPVSPPAPNTLSPYANFTLERYNLLVTDISTLNTLHLPVRADNIIGITSEDQLKKELKNGTFDQPYFILGSGANVFFTKDFPGNIILIKIPGRKTVKEDNQSVWLEFGAGENWHEAVSWAVQNNLSGMENLAAIPGTIGAAPVSNLAAYGQNQEDIFESLKTLNLKSGNFEIFHHRDMQFGYRESFFKKNPNYIITSVTYKLSKKTHLNLSYHATHHASLLPTLQSMAKEPYTIQNVYDAVVILRQLKLPDPKNIGTAGCFFKNPLVKKDLAEKVKTQIPDLQIYPADKLQYTDLKDTDGYVKLPAGMLLDNLGWRGKRIGHVGTFPTHALTIVTYPGATGPEVYEFSEKMRADVLNNFEINLEYEVIIV